MLPPESASPQAVALEIGVGVDTLERWRSESLSKPAKERDWTAAARLDAVIVTAAMDEATRSAWCRESGVYLQQLQQWRASAPPRQNTCRLHRTMNLGARRERIGSIRTSIQRSRGSTHAAAGERIAAGGGA